MITLGSEDSKKFQDAAQFAAKHRTYRNFFDACPALGLPDFPLSELTDDINNDQTDIGRPSFEIILRFALIRYHSAFSIFSGTRRTQNYHFLTLNLTRHLKDLTEFYINASALPMEEGPQVKNISDEQPKNQALNHMCPIRDCLLWIWLVTICSWCTCADKLSYSDRGVYKSCERHQQALHLQDILYKQNLFPGIEEWSVEDFDRFGSRFFWDETLRKRMAALTEARLEIRRS